MEVNQNLKIHPLKLLEIPAGTRDLIFVATSKFASNHLIKSDFHDLMKTICKEYQISFESMRKDTLSKLCEIYGTTEVSDIKVGGRKIFTTATPHEVDRMRVVLEQTTQNNKEILDMATRFAESQGCTTTKDFILYAEYFVADLNETVKNYELKYENDLNAAKMNSKFSRHTFDQNYGIQGKRKNCFRQKALDAYRGDNAQTGHNDLNKRFSDLKGKVSPLNQKCNPSFGSDNAASYHFLKHKDFGRRGALSAEDYFKLAEEIVGTPTNKTNAMLSQDGSCALITYIDTANKAKAIVVNSSTSGNNVSVIATVLYDGKIGKV